MTGAYRRTFARFWWLLLLGILLAGLAGVAVVVNEQDQRTYLASTRLLVHELRGTVLPDRLDGLHRGAAAREHGRG